MGALCRFLWFFGFLNTLHAQFTSQCPTNCMDDYDPVCGNDGYTYMNMCYLRYNDCRGSHRVSFNYYGYCENSVQIPRQNNNRRPNSQRGNPRLMPISSSPPQTFTTNTNSILPPNGFVPGGSFTQQPMANGANGFVDSREFFVRPGMLPNGAARPPPTPSFFSNPPTPFNSGPVQQAFIPAANRSPSPQQRFGNQPMGIPQIFAPQQMRPPQGFGLPPMTSSQDFWPQPMISSQPMMTSQPFSSFQPSQSFLPSSMTTPQGFTSQPMMNSPGFPSPSSPLQLLVPASTQPGVSQNFASGLGPAPLVSSQDFFPRSGMQILNGPPPQFQAPPQPW